MSLPELVLDDRTFQELVGEARMRAGQACPEWTEHNVSDPGITLIEVFAWMTETLLYRVNRVPEKLNIALLNLVGITLDPPSAASTLVRFRLGAPPQEPVAIPATTEVATVRTASEEAVVFQTVEPFEIPALRPSAYAVRRGGEVKDVGVTRGGARPQGLDRQAFAPTPAVGDALHLGFEQPLGRLVLQIVVDCSEARGVGVDPEDPPLRWEVSTGAGEDGWTEAEVLLDTTGGFNYGSGIVELQLPERSRATTLAAGGERAHWVRCRLAATTRRGVSGGSFSAPPEIYEITATPVGALLPATNAARETRELLGVSDGTPAQTFPVRYAPMLALAEGETLEVRDPEQTAWEPWEARESFAGSGPSDRHFLVDLTRGEIELGPAIRLGDGSWRQYGAVPPKGAELRLASYRHGGGRRGNVAAGALTRLRAAIPGVASVANPIPAAGGVDAEGIENARRRAALEMRTRYRAVTAEDFEYLATEATPRVARARCVAPGDGAPVRVHVLPRVEPADRALAYDELVPDEMLLVEVAAYLDERRLAGTTIELQPAQLHGVTVVARVVVGPRVDTARVEDEVLARLYRYLNPLVGGSFEGPGSGWPFGRALNAGELYGLVHAIHGVEFLKVLRLYETDLRTGEQAAQPAGNHIPLAPDELIASGRHMVRVERQES